MDSGRRIPGHRSHSGGSARIVGGGRRLPSRGRWTPIGQPFVFGQAHSLSSAIPKQSIYRFRRADIEIYNKVCAIVLASGGEVLTLTACWRSLPEVCALANAVFPARFPKQPTAEAPQFEFLDPVRQSPTGQGLARSPPV